MLKPSKLIQLLTLSAIFLAVPATGASAATTFGAALTSNPIGYPTPCAVATNNVPVTCTLMIEGLADPAERAPGGVSAPSSGVITQWRVKTGASTATSMTFTPRVIRLTNKYTALRSGTPRAIPATGGSFTFAERMPISALDDFAIDSTVNGPMNAAPLVIAVIGTSGSYIVKSPAVPDGSSFAVGLSAASTQKLMINADVEPDVDLDGYGDETQDKCTSRADVQAACPPPTISAPKFSKGTFSFTSDISAKATTTLLKVSDGRKVGTKCKAKAKKGKKCKIYTKFAAWNDDVVPGANKIEYAYKVGGKSLKPGSYRATIVITSAQLTVTTKTVDFKIKKAKKSKK